MSPQFLFLLMSITPLASTPGAPAGSPPPNIILLLADDLGYGEIGCYGQEMIETPVIDRLATEGMRFRQFYAGSPVCSPTRGVLMTGKSSPIATIRGNSGYVGGMWERVPLRPDEPTLAELLKGRGYETVMVGKWHLDHPDQPGTWAANRGFDHSLQEQWGTRVGGEEFMKDVHFINGREATSTFHWEDWQSKDEYYTRHAFEFLDKVDAAKPLFLFMSYRAPHGSEKKIGNRTLYADRGWPEPERVHAAKITLLDQQIGRLLEKLGQLGRLDNTLILFASDNGPHREAGNNPAFFTSSGPFRGIKRDLYEGGVRVPFIAVWPGRIPAGVESGFVGGFQDIVPTLGEIAGYDVPEASDGISILPTLRGENQTVDRDLGWEFQLDGWWQPLPDGGFRQSVLDGDWKAVRYGLGRSTELYNIADDPGETTDLASQHPERVADLEMRFEAGRTDNPAFPYGGVVQERPAEQDFKD